MSAPQLRSIPNALNASIVATQLIVVTACIIACKYADSSGWWVAIGLLFVLAMNSVYVTIHEAEHGVLFSNRALNGFTGSLLALFMPTSYTMIRRVHLAHHIHNRSDEETFDIYFADEPAWWKRAQFFGILTGAFWLTMVVGNFALAFLPMRWIARSLQRDRQSSTVLAYLQRHNGIRMRIEAIVAIALHATIVWWLGPARATGYALVYAAFGLTWSTLQYVHHYGTCRDVLRGAKNLRYGRLLDIVWLNHGWHLTHHLHPTASWRDLPRLAGDEERHAIEPLARAYAQMWRGPVLSMERVRNTYGGRIAQD
jgi:fatty acid desaturase